MTGIFPSAKIIASAIVQACKHTSEDPIACAEGTPGYRGRYYAFAALSKLYSEARKSGLAKCLGASSYETFDGSVKQARRSRSWWEEAVVADIIAAIVATELTPATTANPIPQPPHKYFRPSYEPAPSNAGDPLPGHSALDQRKTAS